MFGLPNVPEIEVQKVYEAVNNKADVIVIDVRTEGEYSRGSIIGSINIPLQDLLLKIEQSVPDKSKTIYVYCLSGSRSAQAVNLMKNLGYTNVYNMTSGLLAWRSKQLPLSTD